MRLIETQNIRPHSLGVHDEYQVYNGLDTALTQEIFHKLPNHSNTVYHFELALQAAIMEMMMRGILIDEEARSTLRIAVAERIRAHEETLDFIGEELGLEKRKTKNRKKILAGEFDARFLNARSGNQLKSFFYDFLGIHPIRQFKKGEVNIAMDEDVLTKLMEYSLAKPVAQLVLEIRSWQEQYKRLKSKISVDGRAHTTYGIAGTTTGRLNSTGYIDDTDWNLQNIAEELRHIFIADPGWKMGSIDKEQAESRMVGFICGQLFGAWKYLDFCEGKDVHTHFCRLVWPEVEWTGDDKTDKKIASNKHHPLATNRMALRDKCKRIGHGANYYGQDKTLAENVFLPVKKVAAAKEIYFGEFPEIPRWQNYVIDRIKHSLPILTPFGWQRHFLGYPNSSSTWREAIAYGPQSAIAHMTNLGLYQCWRHFGHRIRLLLQNHDNIVFLFREDDEENEVMRQALKFFEVPLTCGARTMTIPGEAYTGYNWGYRKEEKDDNGAVVEVTNPRGLVRWAEVLG